MTALPIRRVTSLHQSTRYSLISYDGQLYTLVRFSDFECVIIPRDALKGFWDTLATLTDATPVLSMDDALDVMWENYQQSVSDHLTHNLAIGGSHG